LIGLHGARGLVIWHRQRAVCLLLPRRILRFTHLILRLSKKVRNEEPMLFEIRTRTRSTEGHPIVHPPCGGLTWELSDGEIKLGSPKLIRPSPLG